MIYRCIIDIIRKPQQTFIDKRKCMYILTIKVCFGIWGHQLPSLLTFMVVTTPQSENREEKAASSLSTNKWKKHGKLHLITSMVSNPAPETNQFCGRPTESVPEVLKDFSFSSPTVFHLGCYWIFHYNCLWYYLHWTALCSYYLCSSQTFFFTTLSLWEVFPFLDIKDKKI